jgi:hypothetical protein
MSRVPLPYLDPQNESLSLLIANPKSWNVMPFWANWQFCANPRSPQVLPVQLFTRTEGSVVEASSRLIPPCPAGNAAAVAFARRQIALSSRAPLEGRNDARHLWACGTAGTVGCAGAAAEVQPHQILGGACAGRGLPACDRSSRGRLTSGSACGLPRKSCDREKRLRRGERQMPSYAEKLPVGPTDGAGFRV